MTHTRSLPKLVLATRNTNKADELKYLLATASVEILDLSFFPNAPLVDEGTSSLKENAALKAISAHHHTGYWALGDDTGLCVHALGGDPGVRSARFAGQLTDAEANRNLILQLLKDTSDRTARFVTILALARPQGLNYFQGQLNGHIAMSSMSTQGFGYESIFIPDGFNVSLAQITREMKNKISHRSQAASDLISLISKS